MDQREMDLGEYLESKLPAAHAARRQYAVLSHCRDHPLKWWWWDFRRKWLPFRQWKAPID